MPQLPETNLQAAVYPRQNKNIMLINHFPLPTFVKLRMNLKFSKTSLSKSTNSKLYLSIVHSQYRFSKNNRSEYRSKLLKNIRRQTSFRNPPKEFPFKVTFRIRVWPD